jgi:hypothetical protein
MLLERAIDTPLKLHCVMLFAQRTITSGTTAQVASRLCRDLWSTQQTLDELAEAGILLTLPRQGDTVYEYRPVRYLTDALSLLLEMYNDPVRRDELYNEVRELALYAPYRAHFTRVVAM